ncbi:MAG: hypothetical protein PHV85_05070 [Desulfovibrionaceae bacterium]|nr:hypothetical protein [Desulfovibrionaceae bacterium]
MAVSVIEICNNALLDLGEETIMSLGDDCKAARLCNQRWRAIRDAVLRAHPWNCAMTQTELAACAGSPIWKWRFRYQLPPDFLRVISLVAINGEDLERWEIQGGAVLCDEPAPLYAAYIRRETDPQKYDPLLDEALSARLSASLAYPLSGSTSLAQAFWNIYQQRLAEARGVDAREGVPENISPTTWLRAKLGA